METRSHSIIQFFNQNLQETEHISSNEPCVIALLSVSMHYCQFMSVFTHGF